MDEPETDQTDQQTCVYQFGPFQLNPKAPANQRLLRDGIPVELTPMEFSLLWALVREHKRKLLKEELVVELWPNACADPKEFYKIPAKRREGYLDNLHHHTWSLRKKLGEKEEEKYIDTKNGYSLRLPVKELLYEKLEFEKWIFYPRKGRPITLAFAVPVALSILYLIFGSYLTPLQPKPAFSLIQQAVLSLIQAVVILGAFIASFFIFSIGGKEFAGSGPGGRAKPALKQYFRYWRFLLVSWVLLYLLLFFTKYLELKGGQRNLLNALYITVTLFNNCNSLAIVLCYLVLNHPAAFKEQAQQTRRFRLDKMIAVGGVIFILLFALAEVFMVSSKSPEETKELLQKADLISGLVGGIALALYVYLLNIRFPDRSLWLFLAFLLYAVIQPLYFIIGVGIIEAALILKCLLYLYITWLFKSGRLLVLFSSDESKS